MHFARTFYFFDAKAAIEMPQRTKNTTSTRTLRDHVIASN